ncbi:hypothetical protein SUGI_0862020 [Cryptomeria japonica]|nr:hypothetical protein SUGI_0862020 [Cryptomeria japonica]
MGSALETLCGQAFGAGNIQMLGIYLQRSWLIVLCTAVLLSFIYIFATPILKLLGQEDDVADLAGICNLDATTAVCLCIIFPNAKVSSGTEKTHGCGLDCLSCINSPCFSLLVINLQSGDAWKGFSWLAFHDLWAFVRLSLASAVMLCLEFWYMMSLIVLTGHLKNAAIEVDAISICMNLNGCEAMIFIGFNVAISVRVSNELGAGRSNAAKFSVIIVILTSLSIGLICMGIILATKNEFAVLFINSKVVMETVSNMAMLLGVTMVLNSVQPVLSGVAVGGGWQGLIAYVNVGCYYVIGLPLGLLMGYKFDLGAKGIWTGMICGTALQTVILLLITYFTNWNREAAQAEDRIRVWGGSAESYTNRSSKGKENAEYENNP